MLDHVFLSVRDTTRPLASHTASLAPLGITHLDEDRRQGSPGHRALQGFDANGRGDLLAQAWQGSRPLPPGICVQKLAAREPMA